MLQHKNIKAICGFHPQQVHHQDIFVRVVQKEFWIKFVLAKFQSWDRIAMDTNMQII